MTEKKVVNKSSSRESPNAPIREKKGIVCPILTTHHPLPQQKLHNKKSPQKNQDLNPRHRKIREIRPIPEPPRVASDADPMGEGRRRSVEDKELVPPGGRDVRVRRGGDGARVPITGEGGEDGSAAHVVSVCARRRFFINIINHYLFFLGRRGKEGKEGENAYLRSKTPSSHSSRPDGA